MHRRLCHVKVIAHQRHHHLRHQPVHPRAHHATTLYGSAGSSRQPSTRAGAPAVRPCVYVKLLIATRTHQRIYHLRDQCEIVACTSTPHYGGHQASKARHKKLANAALRCEAHNEVLVGRRQLRTKHIVQRELLRRGRRSGRRLRRSDGAVHAQPVAVAQSLMVAHELTQRRHQYTQVLRDAPSRSVSSACLKDAVHERARKVLVRNARVERQHVRRPQACLANKALVIEYARAAYRRQQLLSLLLLLLRTSLVQRATAQLHVAVVWQRSKDARLTQQVARQLRADARMQPFPGAATHDVERRVYVGEPLAQHVVAQAAHQVVHETSVVFVLRQIHVLAPQWHDTPRQHHHSALHQGTEFVVHDVARAQERLRKKGRKKVAN